MRDDRERVLNRQDGELIGHDPHHAGHLVGTTVGFQRGLESVVEPIVFGVRPAAPVGAGPAILRRRNAWRCEGVQTTAGRIQEERRKAGAVLSIPQQRYWIDVLGSVEAGPTPALR